MADATPTGSRPRSSRPRTRRRCPSGRRCRPPPGLDAAARRPVGDTVGTRRRPAVGGAAASATLGGSATICRLDEGTSLLDLDVDLDADLDAAAPINAGVAANANAALPIDAAVSANTLSPGAQSLASASQDSLLSQNIDADAIANSTQDSTIGQGEAAEDPAPAPDPADTDSSSLLDLDANVDLGLDLAAPVDAAVAANATSRPRSTRP